MWDVPHPPRPKPPASTASPCPGYSQRRGPRILTPPKPYLEQRRPQPARLCQSSARDTKPALHSDQTAATSSAGNAPLPRPPRVSLEEFQSPAAQLEPKCRAKLQSRHESARPRQPSHFQSPFEPPRHRANSAPSSRGQRYPAPVPEPTILPPFARHQPRARPEPGRLRFRKRALDGERVWSWK